jgi:hypothetical protein
MIILNPGKLKTYRQKTHHLLKAGRVDSPEKALRFVNERGFVFFWPIQGVELPSLWKAAAGDRDVPNDHDDPGHITWGWKDSALDQRIWYYAKILRRKATIISMEIVPYFYALSENYGSPEEDYLVAYEAGRLSQAAKQLYETLLDKGPLDTISLRKEARMLNAKESLFNRALEDLQSDFKILPIGIAEAGAWRYAYRYEITPRYHPELPLKAQAIGEAEARQKLAEIYFLSVGAAQIRDVVRLFGWSTEIARRTLTKLSGKRVVIAEVSHPQIKGEWFSVPELISA